MLDFVRLDFCLVCDIGKGHGAVVRGTAEDGLGKRGQADLLVEEGLVLLKQVVLAHVCSQDVVCAKIATVEGDDEFA